MEHCSYQIRLVPLLGSSQKGSLMWVRLACPLLRNDFLVLIEILVEANGFCFTRSFFFVRSSYLLGCKCHFCFFKVPVLNITFSWFFFFVYFQLILQFLRKISVYFPSISNNVFMIFVFSIFLFLTMSVFYDIQYLVLECDYI